MIRALVTLSRATDTAVANCSRWIRVAAV